MDTDHNPRFAESDAARMLADALARASRERGLSLRKISPLLDYKQAVVLSHMATGRVPIPMDKAVEMATVLEIDARAFLKAVLKQRHPAAARILLDEISEDLGLTFEDGLATGLGQHGPDLNKEQLAVMREMAADPRPRRRWLSTEEAAAIEILRGSQLATEALDK